MIMPTARGSNCGTPRAHYAPAIIMNQTHLGGVWPQQILSLGDSVVFLMAFVKASIYY